MGLLEVAPGTELSAMGLGKTHSKQVSSKDQVRRDLAGPCAIPEPPVGESPVGVSRRAPRGGRGSGQGPRGSARRAAEVSWRAQQGRA
eukprot:15189510-Alexandrium_andersonii.AAC.1